MGCLRIFIPVLDKIYDKDGKRIGCNISSRFFELKDKCPKLEDLFTSKRDKRTVRLSDEYKDNHELRHILRMIGEYKNRLNWQNFLNESIERFKKYNSYILEHDGLKLRKVKDKINRCKKRFPKFLHSWFDKHVAPRILEREYHPSPVYYTDTNGVRHDLTKMQ